MKQERSTVWILLAFAFLAFGCAPKTTSTSTASPKIQSQPTTKPEPKVSYKIPGPSLMNEEALNEQLNLAVSFAQQMLQDQGGFLPFGNSVKSDGTIALDAADPGQGEHPDPNKVIELLIDAFREGAKKGDIQSCALCVDTRLRNPDGSSPTDAIAVKFAVRDGESFDVALPYKKGFLGKYKYGELVRMEGTLDVKWE